MARALQYAAFFLVAMAALIVIGAAVGISQAVERGLIGPPKIKRQVP